MSAFWPTKRCLNCDAPDTPGGGEHVPEQPWVKLRLCRGCYYVADVHRRARGAAEKPPEGSCINCRFLPAAVGGLCVRCEKYRAEFDGRFVPRGDVQLDKAVCENCLQVRELTDNVPGHLTAVFCAPCSRLFMDFCDRCPENRVFSHGWNHQLQKWYWQQFMLAENVKPVAEKKYTFSDPIFIGDAWIYSEELDAYVKVPREPKHPHVEDFVI